jgi:hypothetical protein
MKRVEDYEEWEKAKKTEAPFIKTQVSMFYKFSHIYTIAMEYRIRSFCIQFKLDILLLKITRPVLVLVCFKMFLLYW